MSAVLITGGAGFVGSALGVALKRAHPAWGIIALDNLKRRGSELNIKRLHEHGIVFVHGDIRNREDFEGLPVVTSIIDASAEPSVVAGINGSPEYVINTNLCGTINCLEFARRCGADVIFLSTSRVYPIERLEGVRFEETETRFAIAEEQEVPGISKRGIAEDFPLAGYRSVYGATKLASELLIAEYQHFYGLRTVINRCGVIAGPWQMGKVDQGFMTLWVAKHYWKGQLQYVGYGGKGKQVRDVLHVEDLADLVLRELAMMDRLTGSTFNVGGGSERSTSLCELTRLCEKLTGNTIEIGSVPETRAADVRIYVSDTTRVTRETGWQPRRGVGDVVQDIYTWIRNNEHSLEAILR